MSVIVSVIIPVRNEERHLGRCLESLTRQNCPANAFEVIVADNGSRDRSMDIAESFRGRLRLSIVVASGRVSAVRNRGAGAATGRIFAFLDADCATRPDWIQRIVAQVDPRGGVATGSQYLIPEDSSWVAREWFGADASHGVRPVSYLPGGCLIVPRPDFERVRGFDDSLETNEDFELCQRLRESGAAIITNPALAVIHYGTPQTLSGFFRQQRWHGKHVARVFLRDISKRRNLKAVAYAAFTILCWAGILAAAAAGLCLGNWMVLAAVTAAWIGGAGCLAGWRAQRLSAIPAVTLLCMVYGAARALCLLHLDGASIKAQAGGA